MRHEAKRQEKGKCWQWRTYMLSLIVLKKFYCKWRGSIIFNQCHGQPCGRQDLDPKNAGLKNKVRLNCRFNAEHTDSQSCTGQQLRLGKQLRQTGEQTAGREPKTTTRQRTRGKTQAKYTREVTRGERKHMGRTELH